MASSNSVAPNIYAERIGAARKEYRAISRERFKSIMALAEPVADFLTCAFGVSASQLAYASLHIGAQAPCPVRELTAMSITAGLFVVFLMQRDGAYRQGSGLLQIRDTERVIRSSFQSLLLLMVVSSFWVLSFSCVIFLIAGVLIPLLLIGQKQIFFAIVRRCHLRDYGIERVIVYGAGETGRSVVSTLFHAPRLGYRPIAMIDGQLALDGGGILGKGDERRSPVPVKPGPITPSLLKSLRGNVLMVATPNLSREEQTAATDAAKQVGLGVIFVHGPATHERQCAESIDIDGLLLTPQIERTVPWYYAAAKRTADLAASSLLLFVLAPLLFLIAILVQLDSHGPALFVQKRVGRKGELFDIYKFRSMYTGAPEYETSPITSSDRRITRIGRFIRRTSLDELPQLINVLRGQMSLVGPRPEMPFVVDQYNPRQRQRLQVIPGITGLWQLSADRAFPIHHNIHYDLYYIRSRTFFMDMAILIHTLFFAMRKGI